MWGLILYLNCLLELEACFLVVEWLCRLFLKLWNRDLIVGKIYYCNFSHVDKFHCIVLFVKISQPKIIFIADYSIVVLIQARTVITREVSSLNQFSSTVYVFWLRWNSTCLFLLFWKRCKHGVRYSVFMEIRCEIISIKFESWNIHSGLAKYFSKFKTNLSWVFISKIKSKPSVKFTVNISKIELYVDYLTSKDRTEHVLRVMFAFLPQQLK